MLIRSIRAENFMRFSSLKLTHLPLEGIIGIEGPNESGKSTLGEILLFAFFGKMRPALDSSLVRLIRWGASSMWVEVEFAIRPSSAAGGDDSPPAADYLIYREIDKYGTNYVKILELPARKEVATGNIQVADFLLKMVRFDFQEFQQSFYHDQFENRRMQTEQVVFFERATGIDHMRQAMAELQREVTQLEREFSYYEKETARNRSQVERYERNVQKLEALAERGVKYQNLIGEQSGQTVRSRARARRLRQEATAREERARRLEGFAALPLERLAEELDGQVAAEGNPGGGLDAAAPADANRSEAGAANPPFQSDGMRDVLAGMLPRLERLRDLARDMMELYHLMSDELEDVGKDLSPETPEGPVSQIGRLEDYSRRLSRRLRRARRSLLVLVAIIAAGVGGALVAPFLASRSAGDLWQELRGALFPAAPWLLPWLSGALLVVLCLAVGLFYSRLKGARRKLTEARRARARFEEKLTELEGVQAALTGLAGLTQSGTMLQLLSGAAASGQRLVVRRAAEVRQRYSDLSDEGGEEALARFVGGIVQSQRRLNGFLAEEAARLEKEAQEAEATLKKSRAEKEKVDNELRECQSQAAKKQALEEKSAELEAGAAQVRGEIDLRLLACRLLEETIASMRGKIGPGLTRFAKSVLPRLTSDRYREVKVEESLEIKVFSSEKSDFLSLYELSGGTNEALSLALRLALSQTLVASRMRQAQFVFLDEPFKMMDMKRAVETLRALRELSPDLKQFLVIQPDFSDSERSLLDSLIETSVKDNKLERTCTAQRRESGARAAAAGGSGEAHAGALSPQRDRRA